MQHFVAGSREQAFLLPPDLREWLAEDHLAWFVVDVVEELDLDAFRVAYRDDGWGRPAFDPALMVGLLLYAYCIGERSSRVIERRCREDVAFRVVMSNLCPDHATVARFRARHESALADVFTQVLRLCAEAGLVSLGVLAIDGTKLKANAAKRANSTYAAVRAEVEQILAEAAAADAAEDEQLGGARGDELPTPLATHRSRRERLRAAKARLDAENATARAAHAQRLAGRAEVEAARGKRLRGRKPKAPPSEPAAEARVNTSDPDSALMRAAEDAFVQGYNAQTAVADGHLIVAAELTQTSTDAGLLAPMVAAARRELGACALPEPGVVLADAGYWNAPQIEQLERDGQHVLVSPTSRKHLGRLDAAVDAKLAGKRLEDLCLTMHQTLAGAAGAALYARRFTLNEPVFAQTKAIRGIDRFHRRGLAACRSEWRLIAATHNLLKLWRYRAAPLPVV